MSSFWLGVASGVPLMIAVGPVSVLLIELGISRGGRAAWPAAVGVAGADLTYATIAAASGAAMQRALHPYATAMRWIAAAALALLAVTMLRKAVRELRARHPHGEVGPTPAGATAVEAGATGASLAARFYGLTILNPLTVAAFTTLVLATGGRASHVGWPLGIASASVVIHLLMVAAGAGLRRTLPPLGAAWCRLAGGVLVAGLAANLALS